MKSSHQGPCGTLAQRSREKGGGVCSPTEPVGTMWPSRAAAVPTGYIRLAADHPDPTNETTYRSSPTSLTTKLSSFGNAAAPTTRLTGKHSHCWWRRLRELGSKVHYQRQGRGGGELVFPMGWALFESNSSTTPCPSKFDSVRVRQQIPAAY